MNFTTFCDNDGCRKEMQPVVDKDTLVAYCTECGEPINTVSEFMRRQMVAFGLVRKLDKKKVAYSVKCGNCGKEGAPELTTDKKGVEKLCCGYCGHELDTLAKPFAEMVKTNLRAIKRAGK